MAAHFGVNYERHPMIAPTWNKLEAVEQHLDRLDIAVNAILKHLNIEVPGLALNQDSPANSAQAQKSSSKEISDEPYQYKSLDVGKAEIRLFAVDNASSDNEDIRGSLVHISLEDKELATRLKRYKALSYTWGPPKFDSRIVIDGHAFYVTHSLQSALQQMRKTAGQEAGNARGASNQEMWWIDQICTTPKSCMQYIDQGANAGSQASTKQTSRSEEIKCP